MFNTTSKGLMCLQCVSLCNLYFVHGLICLESSLPNHKSSIINHLSCLHRQPTSLHLLRIPSTGFAHRPLPHRCHNIFLHMLTPILQILVFTIVPRLPHLLPHIPNSHNQNRDWYIHSPIYPKLSTHNGCSRVLEVEECHGKDGGDIGAGEEDCAEQRYHFHGLGIALAGVGELALLASHLKVEFTLFLSDNVVQLFHIRTLPSTRQQDRIHTALL